MLTFATLQCHKQLGPTEPLPYSPPNNLSKLVPLQVGNTWTYRRISWDIGGADTTIDSIQIVDTVRISGKKYFVYNGTPAHLIEVGTGYLETLDSADYSMYDCVGCLNATKSELPNELLAWLPVHILKTPLIRGKQWRAADWDSVSGYNYGIMTIVNPDTTITLPIGEFHHAILVDESSPIMDNAFVIVPGIGVVLQWVGFLPDTGYDRELIAWKAK